MGNSKVLELNNDKDLVRKVSKGSHEAFDILFMKYWQKLYRFSYRFLKSQQEAEGIVQEVFMKLWEDRDQLNPNHSFNSFIFTITKNRVLNRVRRRVHEKKYLDSISAKQVFHDFGTEEKIEYSNLLEVSRDAINSLPPKRKQVFKMSREQGMTYEEIASALGISRKTVENQMTMTLKTLRNYLRRHAEISFPASFLILSTYL